MAKNSERKRKRSPLLIVAFLIALGVFVFSGIKLSETLVEYENGRQEYAGYQKAVDVVINKEIETKLESDEGFMEVMEDESYHEAWVETIETVKTQSDNPEVFGWIWIPNTKINYPMVQGADNEYYLKHTVDHRRNSSGAIFLDYRNSQDFSDPNTVIHGHHMRNGSMFGGLVKFRKQSYFNSHPYVYITRSDGSVDRYGVYACYVTAPDSKYNSVHFGSKEKIEEFFKWTQKQSEVTSKYKLTGSSRIITLSTCAYDFKNARATLQAVYLDTSAPKGSDQEQEP